MLRIYICPNCYNLRMVSRKTDAICFHCGTSLVKCEVSYETYINMSEAERNDLKSDFKQRMAQYHDNISSSLNKQKI